MPVDVRLSDEILARFAGGSITIENELEGYKFEGTIASTIVRDGDLVVVCDEIRQVIGEGGAKDPNKEYRMNLECATDIQLCRTQLIIDTTPIFWEKITITCKRETAATAEPIARPPQLTDEQLAELIGADVEIHVGQGPIGDTWRGPVETATIVDNVLAVTCRWVGFLPEGTMQWKCSDKKEFRWPLQDYDIRAQSTREGNRLLLTHKHELATGLIVFFPKGKHLNPEKVEGLSL